MMNKTEFEIIYESHGEGGRYYIYRLLGLLIKTRAWKPEASFYTKIECDEYIQRVHHEESEDYKKAKEQWLLNQRKYERERARQKAEYFKAGWIYNAPLDLFVNKVDDSHRTWQQMEDNK